MPTPLCLGDILGYGTVAIFYIIKHSTLDVKKSMCYDNANNISPSCLQEIVSGMCYRRQGALLEKHSGYGMFFRLF